MPAALFVCARDGAKSQMAAGLMRAAAPEVLASAGTDPGTKINAQSGESLAEVGVDISDGRPKPVITERLVRDHIAARVADLRTRIAGS